MQYIRFILKAPLVVLCVLMTLCAMSIFTLLGLKGLNRRIMCLSFAAGCIIVGLRVRVQGTPSAQRPLLLVSNHFSYLDLFAIGKIVPAAFTPKSEIAGWPVIGTLCKMAGCVFIDRRPSKTLENKQLLEDAKKSGEVISLFPEGTTNEGKTVLPFKSSFFSLADAGDVYVQPLSVIYTHFNGKPLDEAALPIVGWYGDAFFFPHIAAFLKHKSADVTLVFHETMTGKQFASRKELAQYCHQQIEKPFTQMLPGLYRAA